MYFILLPGANKAVYLWRPARVCLPRILTCDIWLCRLQTARDATPVHPEAGSGRLQAGATATPTLCRPRWALTDCPGAAMVTQAITHLKCDYIVFIQNVDSKSYTIKHFVLFD